MKLIRFGASTGAEDEIDLDIDITDDFFDIDK